MLSSIYSPKNYLFSLQDLLQRNDIQVFLSKTLKTCAKKTGPCLQACNFNKKCWIVVIFENTRRWDNCWNFVAEEY